jgi:solute:Na+ symporter, SSS family
MDTIIISLYLAGILLLGLWSGRRMSTMEHYSVAGRSFSSLVIFATLSASFIGGGFSIGNAEKVYLFGIVNIVALWGFSLKELLVASFIAPRMGRFNDVLSVGDIMQRDYGQVGKVVTGIFSLLLCAGIVGAQVGGIGIIFHVFLGLPPTLGILIGCGIVITYTTIGGMRAIVFTDVVQFVALAVAIPLTLYLGLQEVGGWAEVRGALPAGHFEIPGDAMTTAAFVSLFLTFLLGETLVPPYVQRLYIGRNAAHTARGTLLSGLFSIPFFALTGALGLLALTMDPELDPNQALPYVIREVLPVGVKGVVIAGIISIVMSSADSFLNAASIAFTHDIVKPLKRQPMSAAGELRLARWVTLVVGLLAVVFAVMIESVIDILIFAYNFWAPVILVPLTAVLLGVRARWPAFVLGALAGVATVLAWNRTLAEATGVDGLIVGVLGNLVVFTFVATFTPHPKRAVGEDA